MPNKPKPPTGAAHRAKNGLMSIGLNLSRAHHAELRKAAALTGFRSMAEFCRQAVISAARKVLSDNGL